MFSSNNPPSHHAHSPQEHCCSLCGLVSLFTQFSYTNLFGDDIFEGLKKFTSFDEDDDKVQKFDRANMARNNAGRGSAGLIPSQVLAMYKSKWQQTQSLSQSKDKHAKSKIKIAEEVPVFETVSTLSNWQSSNAHGVHLLPSKSLQPGIFHDMNYFLSVVGVKFTRPNEGYNKKKKNIRWDRSVVVLGDHHLTILLAECKSVLLQMVSNELSSPMRTLSSEVAPEFVSSAAVSSESEISNAVGLDNNAITPPHDANIGVITGIAIEGSFSAKRDLDQAPRSDDQLTRSPSKKELVKGSGVRMLSPRQFRSVMQHAPNSELKGAEKDLWPSSSVPDIMSGRPFHRSKVSSDEYLDSNVSKVRSGRSSANTSASTNSADHLCTNDTAQGGPLPVVTLGPASDVGIPPLAKQETSISKVEEEIFVVQALTKKLDVSIALSEVLQLQGDSRGAIDVIELLLSEIADAQSRAACQIHEGVVGADLQWSALFRVCHRRLATLYKVSKHLDKAEWHMLEYFRIIDYPIMDKSLKGFEKCSVARADFCSACSLFALVLEQIGGRNEDALYVHQKAIELTNAISS